MYVFGGDHGHYCCNDLHSIDLSNPDALEWRFVEVDGVPPTPRAHVKAIPVGDRVWMYGMTRKGLHSNELKLLDFSSGKPSWSSPIALGEPPCARFGESGVAVVDSNLYIFGGYGTPATANAVRQHARSPHWRRARQPGPTRARRPGTKSEAPFCQPPGSPRRQPTGSDEAFARRQELPTPEIKDPSGLDPVVIAHCGTAYGRSGWRRGGASARRGRGISRGRGWRAQ